MISGTEAQIVWEFVGKVKFIDATGTLLGILVGVSDFNFKRENIVYTEPRNEGD